MLPNNPVQLRVTIAEDYLPSLGYCLRHDLDDRGEMERECHRQCAHMDKGVEKIVADHRYECAVHDNKGNHGNGNYAQWDSMSSGSGRNNRDNEPEQAYCCLCDQVGVLTVTDPYI